MPEPPTLADHPDDDPSAALVRASALVTGTPEEVWWSVATGPGIGTWFVPARVQARVGGAVVHEHGPFGHSHGVVTALEAPRRFAYEEREWGDGVPPWRTEVVVEPVNDADREAAEGPRCRVRLASGVTEDGGRWRTAVEATAEGWAAGMRNLRLVREHFPGQEAGGVFVVRGTRAGASEAWAALLAAVDATGAGVGDEVVAPAGAPALRGVVEETGPRSLLLRTTSPAPGLVELSAHEWSTPSLFVHGHLFGPAGAAVAEGERPRWDAWLHARFPGARPG